MVVEKKLPSKSELEYVISSEQIIREIHELSDDVLLTADQLKVIMQTTSETLKNLRATGDGPLFVKLGGGEKSPVRYPLGEYRKWMAQHTFKNTSQISVSRFSSLTEFLSTGLWNETYIVAIDLQGQQWDFWEAIKTKAEIVDVQWKPMHEILDEFLKYALARYASERKRMLMEGGSS